MNQDLFEWLLLLARWLHITVAVTWIGTSIFFMWLDRSFEPNPESKRPGHVGELWMVHGGGFYHVEKLLMGPTKVPERLHWFKWESYWTWLSGFFLVVLIFYTGDGTFLLDSMVSGISYGQGVALGLFSIFGSWFFYDAVWESRPIKENPLLGHALTLAWFAGMSWFLCSTLSGRAAYIHVGGMIGTWMTANVFLRIIPRQILMVEAARKGEAVNQDWGKNAKNRSTHNTYFTLPVIFIMLSNHFPITYGHDLNWLILLLVCAGGAAIREYFVVRLKAPARALRFAALGVALITGVVVFTNVTVDGETEATVVHAHEAPPAPAEPATPPQPPPPTAATSPQARDGATVDVRGQVRFQGPPPVGKKLNLPAACAKQFPGDVRSNEVLVKNGKLQNVLVRVTRGHEGGDYSRIPTEEVVLDQRGCLYTPRVAATRVGQKVTFVNSDPVFHNVRTVTAVNQKFNLAMPHKDQRETKVFTRPEISLQTKCSVHPWMGAYVAVLDHPFFAVTDEAGAFTLPKLPVGTYTVEAWHEVFGTQEQTITVAETGMTELTFTFK